MKYIQIISLITILMSAVNTDGACQNGKGIQNATPLPSSVLIDSHGAIIRADTTQKVVYIVSSADEFGEGAGKMLDILASKQAKASFFLTGNFLRNPVFKSTVRRMQTEGHYIGPHSDRHLLYNSWENRDSLLVTRGAFREDLRDNLEELQKAGISRREITVFLPPYEWYNRQISDWCKKMKMQVINFTPGTGTNADYTTPDMPNYRSSDELTERLLRFESTHPLGLNGAIILIHLGTHPDRTDKFYDRLGGILDELRARGYGFGRF